MADAVNGRGGTAVRIFRFCPPTPNVQQPIVKILVCLKQILDPEIPPRDFRIDAQRLEADPAGANLVTNIFCENALVAEGFSAQS